MQTRSSLILLSLFVLSLLLGCRTVHNGSRQRDEKRLEAIKKEADALYDAYLEGDYSSAKRSLERSIAVADELAFVPHYQAGHLYFCYARLFVLERKSGNANLAEAALVKARYWSLRESELGNIPPEKAGAAIKAETGDQIMEFIDKWDKNHSNGTGPKYLQER